MDIRTTIFSASLFNIGMEIKNRFHPSNKRMVAIFLFAISFLTVGSYLVCCCLKKRKIGPLEKENKPFKQEAVENPSPQNLQKKADKRHLEVEHDPQAISDWGKLKALFDAYSHKDDTVEIDVPGFGKYSKKMIGKLLAHQNEFPWEELNRMQTIQLTDKLIRIDGFTKVALCLESTQFKQKLAEGWSKNNTQS